jgi:hypothetical protein
MVGRLLADICNVPTHVLPGVSIQLKMTKAKREFYLMNKDADSKMSSIFWLLNCCSSASDRTLCTSSTQQGSTGMGCLKI